MLDFLKKVFDLQSGEWNQTQKEALIDLLLLGMRADHLISLAESDFLESQSAQLHWESGISVSGYLQRAVPKIRNLKSDSQERQELIQDIANRLGNHASKQQAIEKLETLLSVDGTVELEAEFIKEVKEILL